MSWTLTTSGAALAKAGANVNPIFKGISGATLLTSYSDAAEGRIESKTRRSWVANHAGLSTGIKGVLSDVASSMIAMEVVAYDPTGMLTREADMLMNKNDETIGEGMSMLKDFKSNELHTP